MITMLSQTDWDNIKDILGGLGIFMVAMFFLYIIWSSE